MMQMFFNTWKTGINAMLAMQRDYLNAMRPAMKSVTYFTRTEAEKVIKGDFSPQTLLDYWNFASMNVETLMIGVSGAMKTVGKFNEKVIVEFAEACKNTFWNGEGEDLNGYWTRQVKVTSAMLKDYPEAIQGIKDQFGLKAFGSKFIEKVVETDRFILYQVLPTDPEVEVENGRKPVLIIPPYVLGANILAFLPGENRSFVHAFANQGIPTYIRVLKDIATNKSVQQITGEEDVRDTVDFCIKIARNHSRPITLVGYCQGGFIAMCGVLTGELYGLVDHLITCVAPIDGSRSPGMKKGFLNRFPDRFNGLDYGTKILPSSNKVVDGDLMSQAYKIKGNAFATENPFSEFLNSWMMTDAFYQKSKDGEIGFPKIVLAIQYWLKNERRDLPLEIAKMSFQSYNKPIDEDGRLPIRLFGERLSLHDIQYHCNSWQICYGIKDDLVEKKAATIPEDYVRVELTAFPKGHVAIATSWSNPDSACALHKEFDAPDRSKCRGPVKYHLDAEARKRM